MGATRSTVSPMLAARVCLPESFRWRDERARWRAIWMTGAQTSALHRSLFFARCLLPTTCVAPTSRDVTGRDVWVAARKLLSCNCPASYERIIVHYICCSKADTNSSFPASKFLNARLAHRKLPQSFSGKQRQMRQQLRSFCPFTSDGQTDILIINV